MERYLFLIAMILFAISCGKAPINNPDPKPTPGPHAYIENGKYLGEGIAILGGKETIYWAPVNCGYEEVGEVGTDSDHRLGKLYQWGAGDSSLPYEALEIYYDTERTEWNYSTKGTYTDKWNNNQGPCPKGWRLPTYSELDILKRGANTGLIFIGTKYAGQVDVYSGVEFFGDNPKKIPGTGVFFPAAGYRGGNRAFGFGSNGCYWFDEVASKPTSAWEADRRDIALSFTFDSKGIEGPGHHDYRYYAHSVRCVEGSVVTE